MKKYSASKTRYSKSKRMGSSHFHSDKKQGYYSGVCCNPGRRIVLKNGQINTISRNASNRRLRLLQSLFATLVDMQWRYILAILTSSFFLSWLGFALVWWLIALVHGDLDPGHFPHEQEAIKWIPCVTGISGFTSSFLFSMENQHTTGFGSRMPTEECPEGIFVMCIQAIVGMVIQTAMVGVVLAKLARSKQRIKTILFSQNAVICQRNNRLCLMIRIADLQKSNIIEAKLTLQFLITNATMEDEAMSPYRCELKVNNTKPHFYLMWPETVTHVIDHDSPLFDISAEDLLQAKFEIVVILEGTIECTDQRVQARTSYLSNEILWGKHFLPILRYNDEYNSYEIDYKKFDNVTPAEDNPTCSARDLAFLHEDYVNKPNIPAANQLYITGNTTASSSSV